MSKSSSILGVLANRGSSAFRETFNHSTHDVLHYFPGHMAKGERGPYEVRTGLTDTPAQRHINHAPAARQPHWPGRRGQTTHRLLHFLTQQALN